jgi:glutamyl-tRNA reductase
VSVVVVGIEERNAPLELLERVSVGEEALPKALATLADRSNVSEVVVVSTCLRTEVYAVVDRFHAGVDELRDFLASTASTSPEALEPHLSVHFDDDVARHLFSVASGLRSAVLGESEVLGQVRRAWERAHRARTSGPVLGTLFRHAVETGKRVRSETAIARGTTSLSHGAVALAAERRPGGLAGLRAVVVGAGEMGEGVAHALVGQHVRHVTLVNRTRARAASVLDAVVERAGSHAPAVTVAPFVDLVDAMVEADVVFTSVATPHPVVDEAMLADVVERRAQGGSGALLVVDLGVPRNVVPAASGITGVELADMDALRASVAQALSGRQGEVAQATAIVSEEVERYRSASRARGAAPVVAALRSRADEVRLAELARLRAKHPELTDAQWDVVEAVTRATMAKVLHAPTVVVKEAAGTSRGERLVEAVRVLFDL